MIPPVAGQALRMGRVMNRLQRLAYNRYMRSTRWKKKRARAIRGAKCVCAICKQKFPAWKLQAHHLTYDRLYRERMSDLQVVCVPCHEIADAIRERASAINTYMSKVHGAKWDNSFSPKEADEEFSQWLEGKDNAK